MLGGVKIALAVASVCFACGGGKPAPAKPVADTKPRIKDIVQPVKVVAADCPTAATALIKEHGFGKIPKDKQDRARIAAEAEVIAACLDDQWSTEMLACITSRAAPSTCAGQLSEYQEQSLRAHISDWETNWTKGVDRKPDDPPPPPEDDPTPGELHKPNKEPPQEEWISCSGSLADPASYEPKLAATLVDRDYAITVRKTALHRSCEFRWSNPTKKCFGAAHDALGIAACRGGLDPSDKNAVTNAIGDADAKFAHVETLVKSGKAIDCKAVATAHYTDDVFRNKLGSIDPAERKRVFAESRLAMTAACTKEKWSATTRACVVSARPTELDIEECFGTDEMRVAFRYGVPAQGVFFKSGIAECDALAEVVKKAAACDKYEPRMKDMILGSYTMRLGMWLESGGRSRLEVAKQCKDTQTYFEKDARERGCTL